MITNKGIASTVAVSYVKFVPSVNGSLRIGTDDVQIHSQSYNNLIDLEQESDGADSFYIVTIELPVIPLSINGKAKPVIEFIPHNLIIATSMLKAIQLFEEDGGRRHWLSDGNKFERQIGVGRIANGCIARTVRIQKIRKDAILSHN